MKIYVAGPMTGLPDLNFPAFHAETAKLRSFGHTVINPAEVNPDQGMSWTDCMRSDIAELVKCDAIRLLHGWENSKGATNGEVRRQELRPDDWQEIWPELAQAPASPAQAATETVATQAG